MDGVRGKEREGDKLSSNPTIDWLHVDIRIMDSDEIVEIQNIKNQ